MKYSKCIITEPEPACNELQGMETAPEYGAGSGLKTTHLLTVNENIMPDFFSVDCSWIWSGASGKPAGKAHWHGYDEVIGFIGSNRQDPYRLGGEIHIWLAGKEEALDKTCLIFIPAGTEHFPVIFKQIDAPVFFVSIAPLNKKSAQARTGQQRETNAAESKPAYTIIKELKKDFSVAASGGKNLPPPPRNPNLKSTRILHLEEDIVKGAFYVDFVWIYEGTGQAPAPEHSHEWEELIAMVGSDPSHPHDLGGPMSIVLGDEDHVVNKSCLVCIPKGLKHCPWKFLDIKKPTLVFTAGPSGMYTGTHKKD